MKRKAQISIEFIFITGFVLLILTGIVAYSFRQASSNIVINEAANAVASIAAAADSVYALGPGSERQVTVTLPGGTFNSSVSGKSVLVQVHLFGDVSDFHVRSSANLTGSIPDSRGTYPITAKALDSGLVQLSFP